jgi:hypothetical protein
MARHVTRDVAPDALRNLLDRPPRATVAFVEAGAPDALPAHACVRAGRHLFALAATAPALEGREVVLLVDDGPYWFELRGVSVRGIAVRAAPPPGDDASDLGWYAIDVRRVLAWDYGAIREE